jgi:hypothetical protein
MIRDSHLLVENATEPDRVELLRLRAEIFQLAGWFLTQVRQYDLAYAAIRDAIRDAGEAGDHLTAAAGAISQAWLFIRQGRFVDAESIARTTASQIEPRVSSANDAELSAWGWLLLRGSAAAIRNNRKESSDDFLSLAEIAAIRLAAIPRQREYHHYLTTFSPAIVDMKRAESLMIVGDARGVLRISADIRYPGARSGRSDNVNRHLLDVAAAHTDLRDFKDATDILVGLRKNSPEWLQHQRKGKDILRKILKSRKRTLTHELRKLADFFDIAG